MPEWRALPGGLFPEGPGDRIGGDIIAGRTPNPEDVAKAGGYLPIIEWIGRNTRNAVVWLVIIAVGLIGVNGLLRK
jgi:hypothetical protein